MIFVLAHHAKLCFIDEFVTFMTFHNGNIDL